MSKDIRFTHHRRCCIRNCDSWVKFDEMRLYRIPTDQSHKNFDKWKAIQPFMIKRKRKTTVLRYVCHRHFTPDSFIYDEVSFMRDGVTVTQPRKRPTLKKDAYPTENLNIPGSMEDDEDSLSEDILMNLTFPEITLLEDTLPEDSLPENTLPEDTLPEDSLPKDTLPEILILDDTILKLPKKTRKNRKVPLKAPVINVVEKVTMETTSTLEPAYSVKKLLEEWNSMETAKIWSTETTNMGIIFSSYYGGKNWYLRKTVLIEKDMNVQVRANGQLIKIPNIGKITQYEDLVSTLEKVNCLRLCPNSECTKGFFLRSSESTEERCLQCQNQQISTNEENQETTEITPKYTLKQLREDWKKLEPSKDWSLTVTDLGDIYAYFGDGFLNVRRTMLIKEDMTAEVRLDGRIVTYPIIQQIYDSQYFFQSLKALGAATICIGVNESTPCPNGLFLRKSGLTDRCQDCEKKPNQNIDNIDGNDNPTLTKFFENDYTIYDFREDLRVQNLEELSDYWGVMETDVGVLFAYCGDTLNSVTRQVFVDDQLKVQVRAYDELQKDFISIEKIRCFNDLQLILKSLLRLSLCPGYDNMHKCSKGLFMDPTGVVGIKLCPACEFKKKRQKEQIMNDEKKIKRLKMRLRVLQKKVIQGGKKEWLRGCKLQTID